jgi:hypothetical protein
MNWRIFGDLGGVFCPSAGVFYARALCGTWLRASEPMILCGKKKSWLEPNWMYIFNCRKAKSYFLPKGKFRMINRR